ncbi:hypothetical protein SPBR_05052 [Sporothrix brasiliensis 5110]|uniref:CENP-V/GFA domain-containing protein n=1 Tax=Sporothrix brasiliensis 5110 TaxID=1398154 RepID=A0A0C2IDP9_9PEZI|nr:uncharacterized protein SPBR_05052 [Sporothrix brasiliensis 5110]KIH87386.1 hypothetical protein SPBR_05052 [Sporothrix brasiliensis 5110]
MTIQLDISCLCSAITETLMARSPNADGSQNTPSPIPITLCHCSICRQTSGVLCTSYCPIEAPLEKVRTALLTAYTSSPGTKRYFCRTCGCHIFRRRQKTTTTADDANTGWEVATGVIANEWSDHAAASDGDNHPVLEYVRHDHVDDTHDGGLAKWLPTVGGKPMGGYPGATRPVAVDPEHNVDPSTRTVSAACHCGAVQFEVRPPDMDPAASREPHSGFSDLLLPFATTDPAITANPGDVKWWLRPAKDDHSQTSRWLAGTCACRSCRLATGFEIQTWAFVPRACIVLQPGGQVLAFGNDNNKGKGNTPPALAAYQSMPGVERNFCNRCGATVFWHDIWRPDLIDISVGLFRPKTDGSTNRGSRIEDLLDWCTTRVSFVEEASRNRHGQTALRGASLMDSLEEGMKKSC